MAIRLQELHSAAVHLPIAMLPVAVGTDLVGRIIGSRHLMDTGRLAIGIAAAGALGAGITGLIAQEEVNAEGEARDTLITHRNLNIAATTIAASMAYWRARHDRPSFGYLAVGVAALGVVSYTASLGGALVYHHGVGVEAAGGQYREDPPQLGLPGRTGEFLATALSDVLHGVRHVAQELARGRIAPLLGLGPREPREVHPTVRTELRQTTTAAVVSGTF